MKKQHAAKTIEATCLSRFDFGDPEAKTDDLLLHCPQVNRGVQEFLQGKKKYCDRGKRSWKNGAF